MPKDNENNITKSTHDITCGSTGLVITDDSDEDSVGSHSDSSGTADSDYDTDDDSSFSSGKTANIEGMEELEKELGWLKPKASDTVSLHSTPTRCAGMSGNHRSKSNKFVPFSKGLSSGLVRNSSAPSLPTIPLSLVKRMAKADSVLGQPIGGMAPPRKNDVPQKSPQTHFEDLLKRNGVAIPAKQSSLELTGFFIEMTDEMVASYDARKARAIREDDVETFQEMFEAGENLQCCNRFGESIVHAACRRASMASLRFLLDTAKVSIKVLDDSGRTPLHDACWTNKPVFELIEFILKACPDLFFIADKRGYAPLEYIRKEFWGEWRDFLDKNQKKFVPRDLA